jgi:hypothetical protein
MRVQIWGGPRDGEALDVPDGREILCVPLPQSVTAAPTPIDLTETPIHFRELPIARHSNGRWYALWHDPR